MEDVHGKQEGVEIGKLTASKQAKRSTERNLKALLTRVAATTADLENLLETILPLYDDILQGLII